MNHSWFWRALAIGVPVLNCGSIMPDPGCAWPGSTPRPSKPTTSVSEAEVRLHRRVLAGGGPDGAFRPCFSPTIRNLGSRWGRERHDVNVNDISEFEDPRAAEDPATIALDHTLTVRNSRLCPSAVSRFSVTPQWRGWIHMRSLRSSDSPPTASLRFPTVPVWACARSGCRRRSQSPQS